VLDCLDLAGRGGVPTSDQELVVEQRLVEHLEAVWQTVGSGVWESRAQPRHYTYSKVMVWVAFDRRRTKESCHCTVLAGATVLAIELTTLLR
jgi:hypothetical protein